MQDERRRGKDIDVSRGLIAVFAIMIGCQCDYLEAASPAGRDHSRPAIGPAAAKKIASAATPAKPARVHGTATYYGTGTPKGTRTANGETFDPKALTAASRTLPFNSMAEVTNLRNGRRVNVRINDRGPFTPNAVLDVTPEVAVQLGMLTAGIAEVDVRPLTRTASR